MHKPGDIFWCPVRGRIVWSATLKLAVHRKSSIINKIDPHSMFQSDL